MTHSQSAGIENSAITGSSPAQKIPERLYTVLALILVALVGWFYAGAVDTEILGFTHDDGVYAITAKALATGNGFTLMHVIGHPGEVKYPFVYPLLLAPVWLIQPKFPDNLPLLNGVTIAFSMACSWLTYAYLRERQQFPGWLALLVVALVASNFFYMYFFSTVMSEAPYLFFSLLALWVAHREVERHPERLPVQAVVWLGVLSAVVFLTRVTGIALMAGIGLWLLLNRQFRNTLVYSVVALVLGVLPWTLWVKFQTPAMTEMNFPLLNAYSNYGLEFLHNFKAGNYMAGLQNNFISLIERLLEDMIPLIPNFFKIYPKLRQWSDVVTIVEIVKVASVYLLIGYFLLQSISTLRKSGQGDEFKPRVFSIAGLYLFFYLLLITLWNYEDQMARFIVVVTPLLWLYFFKPALPLLPRLSSAVRSQKMMAWGVWGVLLVMSVLALWPTANSYRIVKMSRAEHWVDSGKFKWLWSDYKESFAWINANLPRSASMAVGSDVVFHLYTDRPTFYIFYASLRRAHGRYLPQSIPLLMKSLDYYGVRYMVSEPHMQQRVVRYPVNQVALALLQEYPERFERLYTTSRGAISVYRILPPHSNQSD